MNILKEIYDFINQLKNSFKEDVIVHITLIGNNLRLSVFCSNFKFQRIYSLKQIEAVKDIDLLLDEFVEFACIRGEELLNKVDKICQ